MIVFFEMQFLTIMCIGIANSIDQENKKVEEKIYLRLFYNYI